MSGDDLRGVQDPLFARVNRAEDKSQGQSQSKGSRARSAAPREAVPQQSKVGQYVLWGAVFAGIIGLGFYLYQAQQRIELLTENLTTSQEQLASVTEELGTSNEKIGELQSGLTESEKRLRSQGGEINRYKGVVSELQSKATGLESEQDQQSRDLQALTIQKADNARVEQVEADLDGKTKEIQKTVEAANSEIAGLKDTTSQNRAEIDSNRGQITQVSSRTDETAAGLGSLKTSLERELYNFELEKKGAIMKVVNVSLKLTKTDMKKQRFDLEIVADGRKIKKKKQHVNEPVVFYIAGTAKPYEVVVTKVGKNFVVGYLSVPKAMDKNNASVSG